MTKTSIIATAAALLAGATLLAGVDTADAKVYRPGYGTKAPAISAKGPSPASAGGYCHVSNPACPQGKVNPPTDPLKCGNRKCEPGEQPQSQQSQRPARPGL